MKSCPSVGLVLGLSLLVACGSGDEPTSDLPDPPDEGIQLVFKPVTIRPGEDREFCTYFNLESADILAANDGTAFDDDGNELDDPFLLEEMTVNGVDLEDDEIAIERVEIVASDGLHHVQLLALENDTLDYDERHIFACGIDLFGGPLTGDIEPLFFTSLKDYSVGYEPGTARVLHRSVDIDDETQTRGAQLLYNFHYLNPTDDEMTAEVVVNLHTVDRSTVVHPIRSAWWNYVYFKAAAQARSEIDAHGSFLVDVNLVGITSHQHETGDTFTYTRGGQEIYKNTSWSEPLYKTFPADTVLPAGEILDFNCKWNNRNPENRFFGLQADDEMCTAIVEYHPVDEAEAEALLQSQRDQQEKLGTEEDPTGGVLVTLESFLPFPDELLEQIEADPEGALDVIDEEIMCGIAANFKEMEDQYGRSPSQLDDLQEVVDLLAGVCDL